MSFKEWWKKLKYWQKGGIIGFFLPIIAFLIGLFLTITISRSGGSVHSLKFFNEVFGFFITPLCFFNILASSGHPPACGMLFYLSPFIFALAGVLIGLIIVIVKK